MAWDSTRVRRSCARCLWERRLWGRHFGERRLSTCWFSPRRFSKRLWEHHLWKRRPLSHPGRGAVHRVRPTSARISLLAYRTMYGPYGRSKRHTSIQLPCQSVTLPTAHGKPIACNSSPGQLSAAHRCQPNHRRRTTGDMQSATCSRRRAVAGGAAVARVRQRLVGERGAARRDCPADCFRWRVGGWRIAVLVGRGCGTHAVGATHPTCALASVSSPRPTHLKNTTVITA